MSWNKEFERHSLAQNGIITVPKIMKTKKYEIMYNNPYNHIQMSTKDIIALYNTSEMLEEKYTLPEDRYVAERMRDYFNRLPRKFKVYRWVYGTSNHIKTNDEAGHHWSAEPSLNRNWGNIRIEGIIDTKDVDWKETIIRWSEFDEKEIYIQNPSKIEYVDIVQYQDNVV
jgi:hypothetical protein